MIILFVAMSALYVLRVVETYRVAHIEVTNT